MTEPTPYHVFRIGVVSGLLGSLGATVGWIIWLAVRVFDIELLTTVLVGGLLGLTVHWVEQYIHTAKHESLGHTSVEEEEGEATRRPRGHWSLAALVWATGFGFLGLVSEHLVSHMIAEFLLPFLASLATLLPAGVIIGICMIYGRKDDQKGFIMSAITGVMIGAGITLVTAMVWWEGWGSVPVAPLLAWWTFVGLGMRFVTPHEAGTVRFYHPILGVFLALLLVLAVSYFSSTKSSVSSSKVSYVSFLVGMADQVAQSPGLPAEFWKEAEVEYDKTHSPKGFVSTPLPPPTAIVKSQPTEKPPVTTKKETDGLDLSHVDMTPLTADQIKGVKAPAGMDFYKSPRPKRAQTDSSPTTYHDLHKQVGGYIPGQAPLYTPDAGSNVKGFEGLPTVDPKFMVKQAQAMQKAEAAIRDFNKPPDHTSDSWKEISLDLRKGLGSEFVRSWFVLILFAVGLGAAPHVEEILRPVNYPSSRTFRMDLFAATVLALAVLGSCLYLGVTGLGKASLPPPDPPPPTSQSRS